MNIKPAKELRDPIHGFIPIYDEELTVIQDPVFQRLRRIKQLSFGYFVYHGAEHSRFGHVLGVMHLVEKALDKIIDNSKKLGSAVEITEDDIRLARFSALLHDVGHHPFSHALDETGIIPDKHEKYSAALVENHFGNTLEKAGIDVKDVTKLILGKPHPEKPFLHTLVNSQVDVDKFDYLLRDSHYAGVKYGIYDLDRLIDMLFVKPDGELVVLDKGFYTAEQFVLARYHMFSQIYLHKTKRCFEGIARMACEHLLSLGEFNYPRSNELDKDSEIKKFIELDDAWLLRKIGSIQESCMSHFAKCIDIREPFSVVLDSEITALKMMKKKEGRDGSSYLKGIEEDLRYELENTDNMRKIGINKEDILFDKAGYLSYKLRPYHNPIPLMEKGEDPGTIFIYNEKVDSKEAIEDRSQIIRILGEKINIRRTYVRKEKQKALEDYIFAKHPDLK